VERLLLGSVSTALVRRSTVAVLACGEPGAAEVARLERALFGVTEWTDRAAWAAVLADVSARNAGRRTRDAAGEPRRGGRTDDGAAFVGATYRPARPWRHADVRRPCGPDATVHARVRRVESVQVEPGPDGRDRALRVQHGRGSTAIVFE
jgi:hypothetical protein